MLHRTNDYFMADKSKRTPTHLSVRPTKELIGRIDALVPRMAAPGVEVSRSDVVRAALFKGLEVLERDLLLHVKKKHA